MIWDKTAEALQTGMLKLFTAAGMVTGSLIMMFRFSALLTLIFIVFTGIALGATNLISARTLKCAAKRQQCVSSVTSHVEEGYSGRVITSVSARKKTALKICTGLRKNWQRRPKKRIFR